MCEALRNVDVFSKQSEDQQAEHSDVFSTSECVKLFGMLMSFQNNRKISKLNIQMFFNFRMCEALRNVDVFSKQSEDQQAEHSDVFSTSECVKLFGMLESPQI